MTGRGERGSLLVMAEMHVTSESEGHAVYT